MDFAQWKTIKIFGLGLLLAASVVELIREVSLAKVEEEENRPAWDTKKVTRSKWG